MASFGMTATLVMNEIGQIELPEAVKRVFGAEPGVRLRAEVSAERIEIIKETSPLATATTRSASGRLVLAPTGVVANSAMAVRETRDELAERAVRK